MAWTHATADGYMFGEPSKMRVMLFEICRAINEREQLWSGAAIQLFRRANNSQTTFPTMDDLYGMPLWGQGAENIMRRNMEAINNWIRQRADDGIFYETGAFGADAWTLENLQIAIDYEFPTYYPESLTDAAWWQAVIDALNLMIYIRRNFGQYVTSRTSYFKGYLSTVEEEDGTHATDVDAAWDSMRGATEQTHVGLFFFTLRTFFSCGWDTVSEYEFRATSVRKSEVVVDVSAMPGTCLRVDANVTYADFDGAEDTYTGDVWTIDFVTPSATHTLEMPGEVGVLSYEIDADEFDYEDPFTLTVERTLPTVPVDPPFDATYMEDNIAGYQVVPSPIFYLDLSVDLSDQA